MSSPENAPAAPLIPDPLSIYPGGVKAIAPSWHTILLIAGTVLATLAVQDRKSSRHLLFDDHNQLCGRKKGSGAPEIGRNTKETHPLAFSGIHVISPKLLPQMTDTGVFSIIDAYLRLAKQGENISAFGADEYYWRDLGKPENVSQANVDVEHGLVRI